MKCTDSIMISKLLYLPLLLFVTAAEQTLSLHLIVEWFCICGFYFYDNAMVTGKYSYHVFVFLPSKVISF